VRVLLVCPSWGRPCGIAAYTEQLGRGLGALGVEADVAHSPALIQRRLSERRYEGVLLQHEYGLYYFNLVAILTLIDRTDIPFVITMHNTDRRGWMGAQHLFLFKTRARFVVHSEAARDNLLAGRPAPEASRLSVIPMGSPDYEGRFAPPAEVRREMGLPEDGFVVGFFGFAAAHKGIPNLIRALALVPDAYGYIGAAVHPVNPLAVDAIYEQCGLVRRAGDKNRYGNVVLYHGRIPDERFGSYQHAVDVIVFPYEVHGTSISTSMMAHQSLASGRPVVTTDVPYFADLGDEVLKIPDNRPETIAGAVRTLRDDPRLAESLTAKAMAYAAGHRWPDVARAYLRLIA